MTASAPAIADLNLHASPAKSSRWSARPAPARPPRSRSCIASTIRNPARITIDGIDLREMKLSALRRNIGVVFQEVLLFNRSIRENLTVGKPDATDAEMLEALRRAQAIDFVERNPGQAQRHRRRARPLSVRRRTPAALDRARAA